MYVPDDYTTTPKYLSTWVLTKRRINNQIQQNKRRWRLTIFVHRILTTNTNRHGTKEWKRIWTCHRRISTVICKIIARQSKKRKTGRYGKIERAPFLQRLWHGYLRLCPFFCIIANRIDKLYYRIITFPFSPVVDERRGPVLICVNGFVFFFHFSEN